jgi:hypothetical protein
MIEIYEGEDEENKRKDEKKIECHTLERSPAPQL